MSNKPIMIGRVTNNDLITVACNLRRLFPVIIDDAFSDLMQVLDRLPSATRQPATTLPTPRSK